MESKASPKRTPGRESGTSHSAELREVNDARTLRALAHPVRIALLEVLTLRGPLTATEAGEEIGESPTTCSFHLRQLAKYGFVEEAGGGRGRSRPWRMTSLGMQLSSAGGGPEAEVALAAVTSLLRERQLSRYRSWLGTRASYPKAWRDAATESEYILYVTAGELEELGRELSELLLGCFGERLSDPKTRPAGSLPVEVLLVSYPLAPPPPES
ncbi:MAG: winged helix-turn-helix domain-containing protein [Acidimicrobiales bacterium]